MSEFAGRFGMVRAGEHQGSYVEIERDASGTGWHIWVLRDDPRRGPSEGWDIWADDDEQVRDWVGVDQLNVEWIF